MRGHIAVHLAHIDALTSLIILIDPGLAELDQRLTRHIHC